METYKEKVDELLDKKQPLEARGVAAAKPKIAVSLDEMIARIKGEPKLPMVWSGIKEGSFGLIAGPSKSCKTILCENLGMSIAAGASEFLGLPITMSNRKVLFISCEEFYSNRTERNMKQVQRFAGKYSNEWIKNYLVVNENIPRYVTSQDEWKVLYDLIRENEPGVVFIDSMSRLYQGSIEDSKVGKEITEKLRELTNSLKITLIVIHHTHKIFNQPITIHSVAGSRILSQEADFIIGMNRTLDGKRYIKNLAFRYADDNADEVKVFKLDENLWVNVVSEEFEKTLLDAFDGRRDSSNTNQVQDFIAQKTDSNEGKVATKEILEQFVESGLMAKQTLFNQINKLKEDGVIAKLGKGEYKMIPTVEL